MEKELTSFGDAAVDPLIALLAHEDSDVRQRAARTLGLIGEPAKKAVPALVASMKRGPVGAAAWALAGLGDPRGIEPSLARAGRMELGTIASLYGAKMVPGLVRLIIEPCTPLGARFDAIHALRCVRDPPPPGAAAPLVRALPLARPTAARPAVDPSPCKSASSLPDVINVGTTRWTAILEALEYFGKSAAPAIPQLRKVIQDPDERTRSLAREIIVNVTGEDGSDALRFQVDELTGTDWLDGKHGTESEAQAASALATVLRGGEPCPCFRAPATRTEDDEAKLKARLDAVRALGRLTTPAAIPPLIEALSFPDYKVNRAAAEGLARKGAAAAAAVPALDHAAHTHWSPEVAKAAAAALSSIDGSTVEPPPVPASIPYDRDDKRWDVLVGNDRVRVSDAPDAKEEATPDKGAALRPCERLRLRCEGESWKTLQAGQDWLARVSLGEFGSLAIAFGPHTEERKLWRSGGELLALFRLSGEYLFLTDGGRVVKAVPPHPPEPWTAQLVATLPGIPLAWERTPPALIVVVGENRWFPPPGRCAGSGRSAEEVRSWGKRRPGDPQEVSAYSVSATGDVRRLALNRAPPP